MMTIPDNPEEFLAMIAEFVKQAKEDFSMSKEEFEVKYGFNSLAIKSSKPQKVERKAASSKGKLTVPVHNMHTFTMHWMLHYLDLFRNGISLKEYVRRARQKGSDITMKWYNTVEKYRFIEEGIKWMGRQQLGHKSRELLEQLDIYAGMCNRDLEKRNSNSPVHGIIYDWDRLIEGDTPEKLKADRIKAAMRKSDSV